MGLNAVCNLYQLQQNAETLILDVRYVSGMNMKGGKMCYIKTKTSACNTNADS